MVRLPNGKGRFGCTTENDKALKSGTACYDIGKKKEANSRVCEIRETAGEKGNKEDSTVQRIDVR